MNPMTILSIDEFVRLKKSMIDRFEEFYAGEFRLSPKEWPIKMMLVDWEDRLDEYGEWD